MIDKKTYYRGIAMAPYDLIKELSIAMVGILVVVLVLSVVLSSPDVRMIFVSTVKSAQRARNPSVTMSACARANSLPRVPITIFPFIS